MNVWWGTAAWRPLIVPRAASESAPLHPKVDPSVQEAESLALAIVAEPMRAQSEATRHGRNYTWAELMKRVWALDVLECPRCQGRMRILAAISPPDATRKILNCLGLPSRAPPLSPAVSEFTASIEPL